ncbi:hypothetical protein FXO37_05224 [Capsicum annuum]|nr:hypothetical protein FXO37_05224 [Capsicum annuum]
MGYMEFALDSAAKPPIQVCRKDWSIRWNSTVCGILVSLCALSGAVLGKEKEYEVRVRDRDAEWSLGLNIDSGGGAGGEDDDNDSEGGVGILHQNLTSASSALQGLSGRLKKILAGLRADGEEGKQVEALMQLCEMLSIGTEDFLSTFFVDSFVLMLLAARALTHLVDVLPSSCVAVVHYGAVSCFVARLLTIEYMDLAEQSFQTLKKISQEHPTACLRAGALMAVLLISISFPLEFRVALATAANMCKKLPSDASDFVMEVVPLLMNLLQYHDAKENLCSYFRKIYPLPEPILTLVKRHFVSLMSSIGACVCRIFKDILSGSGLVATVSISPALSKPPEQFFDGYGYRGRSFEQTYRFYPASFIEKPQIENGDKIIMPPSALDRLASLHIDYPMLFELRNANMGRVSHCGVLEFIAEEGMIYMPYWVPVNSV